MLPPPRSSIVAAPAPGGKEMATEHEQVASLSVLEPLVVVREE
jgi:hypothetical protein